MSENDKVLVKIKGVGEVYAESGCTISEAMGRETPCGGHGRCGKCKVIARGELSKISSEEERLLKRSEIESGIRLACRTRIYGKCEVEPIENISGANIVTEGIGCEFNKDPIFKGFCVAIDIGTTTLAAVLFNNSGEILARTSKMNMQARYGADVISRIEATVKGKDEELSQIVQGEICDMIGEICQSASVDAKNIGGCVICGNTAMMTLALGGDVAPLSAAPFEPSARYGQYIRAEWLYGHVASDCMIYAAPCVSGFVGGDAVCSVIAATGCNITGRKLVIDIGTNGETALLCGGKIYVCSTAAGPAFEGVGISYGMRAVNGAIDRVGIINGEVYPLSVIGGKDAVGICGSGLIDAMACLVTLGEVDETGELYSRVRLADGVYIDQSDVRTLQVAKSAIRSGIEVLCHRGNVKVSDIEEMYIAGGFGRYLDLASAARIGLLPENSVKIAKFIGNGAITGAYMIGMSREIMARAEAIARQAIHVELSTSEEFSSEFIKRMHFPLVDE